MSGSSNFQQFNPNSNNQLSDAQYTDDLSRSSGVSTGLASSASFNKSLYQLSTFVAAFASMMASKGYAVSDASLSVLTAELGNVLTNADMSNILSNVLTSADTASNSTLLGGKSWVNIAEGSQSVGPGAIKTVQLKAGGLGNYYRFYVFAQDLPVDCSNNAYLVYGAPGAGGYDQLTFANTNASLPETFTWSVDCWQ